MHVLWKSAASVVLVNFHSTLYQFVTFSADILSLSLTCRYPIELLAKAEGKLVDLLENLDRSCDLEEVTRNMEEEEFHHNIEGDDKMTCRCRD